MVPIGQEKSANFYIRMLATGECRFTKPHRLGSVKILNAVMFNSSSSAFSTEFEQHFPSDSLIWGDGAENGIRTHDLRITNALLYQLSYLGVKKCIQSFS